MQSESSGPKKCVCGIIMPISTVDDDHDAKHWEGVKRVIEVAIENAGLVSQPVWQNGEFDVIQSRILKNLFENEIVVCDISTRNPNVMLEFGMRLTTKKPTIVVAEKGTPLPFDTSVINTEFYDYGLDYVTTAEFIDRLTKAICETRTAVGNGTYHSYLEHFRFETVEPGTISVTADKRLEDRLDEILIKISRIEKSVVMPAPLVRDERVYPFVTNSVGPKSSNEINFPPLGADPRMMPGVRVHHAKFGDGTVVEIENNKMEVEFDRVGRKRVMHAFVSIIPVASG